MRVGNSPPLSRSLTATLLSLLVGIGVLTAQSEFSSANADPKHQHFVGPLHEHTAYSSDGKPSTLPEDVFASVKNFGFDFVGISEHDFGFLWPVRVQWGCVDQHDLLPWCMFADYKEPANHLRLWEATQDQVEEATTSEFAPFRGFEWSPRRIGHLGVYFSQNMTISHIDGGEVAMSRFWDWFSSPAEQGGGDDALGVFNHPGAVGGAVPVPGDPGHAFNDFEHVAEADERMVGIELLRDPGNERFIPYYTYALDKGWHVGAVGAEDEHGTEWGSPERFAKTVILADDLTAEALKDAMLARRMYAVGPGVTETRVDFRASGHLMGSRFERMTGSSVDFEISVTPNAASIELVTAGGEIAAAVAGPYLRAEVPVVAGEQYYFATVKGSTGEVIAITSPVWVTGASSNRVPFS